MALTHALSTNNYGVGHLIVATSAANGTHTTLASAMADAVSGDTIILRDSVTESVTLTPGVNISSWIGGSLNTPTIIGTTTMTGAGTCNISGIRLQTNSAALLSVTGSAASIVNLNNCYLNCTNNTGITYSSSSSSSRIFIDNCKGNLGTTGIGLFTHSSAGTLQIQYSSFTNTGLSTTASTCSAGIFDSFYSKYASPITTSSTGAMTWEHSLFSTVALNVTAATIGGGSSSCKWCRFDSGTASAVSIGSFSAMMELCDISSTNTNAITGAGTLTYQGLAFNNTSNTINVTTQTGSGTLQGSKNTAPAAGFLGERISAYGNLVAAGTTGNGKTITSISLTPGVWDISVIGMAQTGSFNLTLLEVGISTTTNTFEGNLGDQISINAAAGAIGFLTCDVPAFRVVITTTTTYYSVARVDYAAGAPTVNSRISGVRVG